ncbi:hypothetical protein BC628DRAFT_1370599, partial [Trametes gibbosa]
MLIPWFFRVSAQRTLIIFLTLIHILLNLSIFPESNEDALVAVLSLGHFFQIPVAQSDARRALECLPGFRAALRYRLGLKIMIIEWVSSGFKELVTLDFNCLDTVDIEAMGIAAYHAIVHTRFNIETHRKYLAYDPPPIQHAPTCTTKLECGVGWRCEWKRRVARRLMHPEEWYTGARI